MGTVCGGAWCLFSGPLRGVLPARGSGCPFSDRAALSPEAHASLPPAGHQVPCSLAASRPPLSLFPRVPWAGNLDRAWWGGPWPCAGSAGPQCLWPLPCHVWPCAAGLALNPGGGEGPPEPASCGPRSPLLAGVSIICSGFHVTSKRGGLGHETLPRGFCGFGSDSSGRPGAGALVRRQPGSQQGPQSLEGRLGWRTRSEPPPHWARSRRPRLLPVGASLRLVG